MKRFYAATVRLLVEIEEGDPAAARKAASDFVTACLTGNEMTAPQNAGTGTIQVKIDLLTPNPKTDSKEEK
ncbi:MAG TPA: hypothetical protein PKW33_00310 [Anaerolineaceae bacterium]|nr:hypothetical protein [Anaerolineaceae bacterium]HPN49999.1 hypothetical protein [Anaerolineaceae bacterium]